MGRYRSRTVHVHVRGNDAAATITVNEADRVLLSATGDVTPLAALTLLTRLMLRFTSVRGSTAPLIAARGA
eukprot:SAG22_NODE_8572_length_644_cov_1.304587_1_plen_71_part_00